MKHHILAKHNLSCTEGGKIVSGSGQAFDLEQYSRMKFGSLLDSRAIGLELGDFIIENAPDIVFSKRKICAPFMYKHVPSAAYTIAKYAFCKINALRATRGFDRIHTRQIYINFQPNADYSKLDKEDRLRYMQDSGLELVSANLDGYNVLMLDDIRITGTYATLVKALVEKYKIDTMLEVYWATVDPMAAKNNPSIENSINSSAVSGIDLIQDILAKGRLKPTLRTLKLLLSHENSKNLHDFLAKLPEATLLELYEAAVGTGHDLLSMYESNYRLLEQIAKRSRIMQAQRAKALSHKTFEHRRRMNQLATTS